MRKTIHICTAVAVMVLALAPACYGQGSSVGTYGGQGGNVAGDVAGGSAGDAASPASSSGSTVLPFTGLDVAFLGGGGLLLMVAGALMAGAVGRTTPDAAAPAGGLAQPQAAE